MPFAFLPRGLAALALAAAVALPVAGCGAGGSSGGDAGADPAAALPASAPLYVEAQVRPEGNLRANVDAVARKLLHTGDPAAKITELVDAALKDQGASYAKDIEPWLGRRAGFALSAGSGGKSAGVAALASKDDAKAQAFVDGRRNTESREYRGVAYRYTKSDDTAAAVVDHLVLVGNERAFKSAVDATKGDALAHSKGLEEARNAVGTDGAGFLYVDPARALDLAVGHASSGRARQVDAFKALIAGSGVRSIAASLDIAQDALRVDAAVLGLKSEAGAGDGPGAAAAVPADAWLSAGVGDVGATVTRTLSRIGQSGGIGGLDPQMLLAQLKSGLGVDVQKDFLAWMGDAAVFVRGTTMADLDGALVVHSKNAAASQNAVGVLRGLLPKLGVKVEALRVAGVEGLRVPLGSVPGGAQIAAKGDLFVVALGRGALADALATGGPRLGTTDAFKTAAALLGGAKPSFFLDTPQVVRLIGSTAAGDKPGFQKAKPTLDALGPAAAGASSERDLTRIKLAVAVR